MHAGTMVGTCRCRMAKCTIIIRWKGIDVLTLYRPLRNRVTIKSKRNDVVSVPRNNSG